MQPRHPLAIVVFASIAALAVGFWPTPFWDEDEPRFAAIARTMVVSGDWIVPTYNGTVAVDKPVLMHWCMAACFGIFGTCEVAARLPAAAATLLTALALLRAGTRWFSPLAGILAALAYVGCLLVAVESHAATPDAILTALTTWATVLMAEAFVPTPGAVAPGRLTPGRAGLVGALMGLAVLCKGPIGCVGPFAVILPWVWGVRVRQRVMHGDVEEYNIGGLVRVAWAAAFDALRATRFVTATVAMLAVAAPWYVAVGVRTAGAWPTGFFLVHNVGRFAAPMEKHGGGFLYHPLGLLVGFYPWSCFLPLAVVVVCWRLWKGIDPPGRAAAITLILFWMLVWVGGFSAAATKLPNYIMPAYPAAALVVAAFVADVACSNRWAHPGWMVSGLGWLAFGGLATAATVIAATFVGLSGGAPAAVIGLVPVAGAIACLFAARRGRLGPVMIFAATGLTFTALAVGPAAAWLSRSNTLPSLVREAHHRVGGHARLGAFGRNTPNIVYYAEGPVAEWLPGAATDAGSFLKTGSDAIVIVPEPNYPELAERLPAGFGIVGRARPLFHKHDYLLVGRLSAVDSTASVRSLTR